MRYTLEEHQEKQLVPRDFINEQVSGIAKINTENLKILNESAEGKKKRKLIVTMEAIHVGRTKNFTFYTEEGLKAGLSSWTHPYNKPVLTHHNAHRGEPIGRILNAEFSEKTLSGKPGLIFTVEITDQDAIEKVLDGRYQTVSIGASTDKVTCNICGKDRTEEWCEHWPGKKYDEQTCHFIIGPTFGREVSYVNTPSDENARNVTMQIVEDDDKSKKTTKESAIISMYQIAEGLYQDVQNPEVNLYEHLNDDVKKLLDLMATDEGSGNQMGDINEQLEQQPEENKPADQTQETKQTNESTPIQEDNSLKKIEEMQKTITDLVLENKKLQSKFSDLEEENKRLVDENVQLRAENHKYLAEKVVRLKEALHKSDILGKTPEEAIEDHVRRTKESLMDTLKDLTQEYEKSRVHARPLAGSVKNPGLTIDENENSEDNKDKDNKLSYQEAVATITKMFGSKRK